MARSIEEMLSSPSFEEDADIGDQDADAMRWHAIALRARCRWAEDKEHPQDKMITISTRWARCLAKALLHGAEARELFDA